MEVPPEEAKKQFSMLLTQSFILAVFLIFSVSMATTAEVRAEES